MNITWRNLRWVLVGLLLVVNLFVWSTVERSRERGFLVLAAFDVGQGDAIFIEDSVGHQILIDGGPDQKILSELPKLMPLSDRTLDLLILTHPHADHVTGLVEILKRYQVGAVLKTGADYPSATYDEWRRLLKEKGIQVISARRGEKVKLAGGVELDILAPFTDWRERGAKNIHDAMVVAQLVVASSTVALLAGDMEMPLEAQLLAAGDDLKSAILKVGHHGSKTSSSETFVRAVTPRFAIISAGAKNRYGHPHPNTLATLKRLAGEILRTDERGTITFDINNRTGIPSLVGL